MNRSIRIACALLLFSSIISCKKNKDAGSDSETNKTRLSKIIQWDVADASKNIITTEFTYDDQKRVAEISSFKGDSVGGEIKSTQTRSLKFIYNGDDTKAYKTIGPMPYFPFTGAEIFHTYNSSGNLIQDSVTISPGIDKTIVDYNYLTDKIVVQISQKGNSFFDTRRDSFVVADHNIKEFYMGLSGNQSTIPAYKMSYDDKISPLSKLNIAALMPTKGLWFGFPAFFAPGYCKNNITQYAHGSFTGPGNFTQSGTVDLTYTYNKNNLPTECKYSGWGATIAVKFEYTD